MEWLERAAKLRQWSKGGTRAPHKPLLLLYALARFQQEGRQEGRQEGGGELRYSAVEGELQRLLAEYGPPHRTTPAYPFHHLVSDGVWEVRSDRGPGSPGTGVRDLRATGAAGRLAPQLRADLVREPALLGRMARVLLELHFPPSLHAELCGALGLDPDAVPEPLPVSAARRRRDRRMRELVLTAYEYRCAFCGYDGRVGAAPAGLEAAHVRWSAYEGPDSVDNGLCLCAMHHKLFDKGVLGVDDGHRVLVSQQFVGHGPAARAYVTDLAGSPLIGPQPGALPVAAAHRAWHLAEVFKGPARPPAASTGAR